MSSRSKGSLWCVLDPCNAKHWRCHERYAGQLCLVWETNNWKFEGKHAIPRKVVHSKCILAIWSITSYNFKVELIMETSMFFLPCLNPNPKPKPQSCQSCPVPLAQFIIYHSTRTLWIWELPSSLLKHMSFEGCGGREASFPWAKSWGEFDHLTTCSKSYKCKVFILNNQGTHFHPFSTSMIVGGRVRSRIGQLYQVTVKVMAQVYRSFTGGRCFKGPCFLG